MAKLGLEKKLFTLNRDFCAPCGWKGVSLLYITAIGDMGMKNLNMNRAEVRETRGKELLGGLYHFRSNEREEAQHAE